jgi:predicted XRE-type DNA-binding protein
MIHPAKLLFAFSFLDKIQEEFLLFKAGSAERISLFSGFSKKRSIIMDQKASNMEESSGNVFADLGLPNAEQELLKARLILQIYEIIKQRGLTQSEAGRILGIKQPHVSALMRNRSGNFSLGRLMTFLTALDQDVEITVRPKRSEHAEVSVIMQ